MDKVYFPNDSKTIVNVIVDNKTIVCEALPKAKLVKYSSNAKDYKIINYYYNSI